MLFIYSQAFPYINKGIVFYKQENSKIQITKNINRYLKGFAHTIFSCSKTQLFPLVLAITKAIL